MSLGPVNARWSMEEFFSTPDDDDVKFVGTLNDTGLFTPTLEGPNPARKKQSNNYPTNNWGDIWVNAIYDVSRRRDDEGAVVPGGHDSGICSLRPTRGF